jgi:hypothetical protein
MIKETKEYFCDICKKQMDKSFGSLHFYMQPKSCFLASVNIDCKDVCEECCRKLDSFICDLERR